MRHRRRRIRNRRTRRTTRHINASGNLGDLYKQAGEAFVKETLEYLSKILPNLERGGRPVFDGRPVFRAAGMGLEVAGNMTDFYCYGYGSAIPSRDPVGFEAEMGGRSVHVEATGDMSAADAAHAIRDAVERLM